VQVVVDTPAQVELSREVHHLVKSLGDVSHVGVMGGIEAVLVDIEHRLATLEAGGSEPTLPSAEATLVVDSYSNGFVRVRDTGHLLSDGQEHVVNMAVAPVAGPGGTVYPDANGIPAGSQPAWFDEDGSLGYIVTPTGSNVSQSAVRNYTKYGNQAAIPHYLLWVTLRHTADGHPELLISRAVSVQ
jgi:hypothetical protein